MFDDSGYGAYQHTQVDARAATADPRQLVLMLVEGFMDELARLEGHLTAGNIPKKGMSLARCMDLLGGLDTALDLKNGGPLVEELHRLYDYMGMQLLEVGRTNDVAGLEVVKTVMGNLREGWEGMKP